MIQYLLLQNRQGKTRLSKYYRAYTDDEKHKLEGEIHRLVTTRDPKFTNFVEARPHTPPRAPTAPAHRRRALSQYRQYKLIYRRYAGLFFTLCVVRRPPTGPSHPHATRRGGDRRAAGYDGQRAHVLRVHPPLRRAPVTPLPARPPQCPLTLSPAWLPTATSDQFFGNVCELDLVFNFNKVYMILDEFFLAGEVQETSKQAILHRVQELDKAE